jgi:hypothetical protein
MAASYACGDRRAEPLGQGRGTGRIG